MWDVLLDTKAIATDAIKHHQAAAKKECDHKLRVLRTDIGGEFMAVDFMVYCADEGV
jgi:hypothetical protein